MPITVAHHDLLAALRLCAAVAPRTPVMPILSSVLIDAQGARLRLAAADLSVWAHAAVDCGGGGISPMCAPALLLAQIVAACDPRTPIEIAEKSHGWLELRSASATFQVATLPVGDFPRAEPPAATEGAVTGDAARHVLDAALTVAYASRSGHRADKHCVWIATNGMGACATDGFRVALWRKEEQEQARDFACVHLRAIRAAATLPDPVELTLRTDVFAAASGSALVWAKPVDAPVPDMTKLPKPSAHPVVCQRSALLAALAAVEVAGWHAELRTQHGALVVATADYEGQTAVVRVEAKGMCEAVLLNVRQAREALAALTVDTVSISTNDRAVRFDGDAEETGVVARMANK